MSGGGGYRKLLLKNYASRFMFRAIGQLASMDFLVPFIRRGKLEIRSWTWNQYRLGYSQNSWGAY